MSRFSVLPFAPLTAQLPHIPSFYHRLYVVGGQGCHSLAGVAVRKSTLAHGVEKPQLETVKNAVGAAEVCDFVRYWPGTPPVLPSLHEKVTPKFA